MLCSLSKNTSWILVFYFTVMEKLGISENICKEEIRFCFQSRSNILSFGRKDKNFRTLGECERIILEITKSL